MPNWPLEVWIVPQSTARLCLRVVSEDVWVHPCCLKTKICFCHCQTDGRCAVCGPVLLFWCSLGGFAQSPSMPLGSMELLRSAALMSGASEWLDKIMVYDKEDISEVHSRFGQERSHGEETGVGREKKTNQKRREGSLVFYEEPVAQQMGIAQTKWQEEISQIQQHWTLNLPDSTTSDFLPACLGNISVILLNTPSLPQPCSWPFHRLSTSLVWSIVYSIFYSDKRHPNRKRYWRCWNSTDLWGDTTMFLHFVLLITRSLLITHNVLFAFLPATNSSTHGFTQVSATDPSLTPA